MRVSLTRAPSLTAPQGSSPLSRKDAALLAVLALDGACARDTLARMLWPDSSPVHALANLRQRRFRLARVAGGPVVDGDRTLRLTDAVRHPAAEADRLLQADPAALDGDLLEGLDFADCPDLDHWLQPARERWQVLRAQALGRLASKLEAAAQLATALAVAQRLAADEPLSDHAARRLMRLHHRRGDLGAAIDAYRRFAERLDAELGERPDDETAALAASLRQGIAPAPRAVPPTLARPPRRIGRDAAWAALQGALVDGRSLIVEGAPGVGKSRLLGDFVAESALRGLHLAALAGDAARPYALLVRLLSRLWLDPRALRPGGAEDLPTWARRELAVLLPELGDAVRQTSTLRLQRAAALALRGAGLRLVALDDIQQADAATLELLPALAEEGGLCWLLGLRSDETPPALQPWLQASKPPQLVRLAALDRAQLAELLGDLALPGIDGPDWAEALARHTGGLPLFVLETLRSLHEMPTPALDALPPPADAAQAVRARATRLPEAARQLAHAAAVLAAPLALDTGAALFGGRPADWAGAFGALESAQWLDAGGRMHDLVAAALREAMPAAERRWLHSRIGERLAAGEGDPLVAAGHWEAAGVPAQAAPLLEDAAQRAGRAGRPAEQIALCDRAMACWAAAGQPDRRLAAWRDSAQPRLFLLGPRLLRPEAQLRLEEAGNAAQRLDALIVLAETCLVAMDLGAAELAAAQALTLARRLARPALRVRAVCSLAASQAQQGRVSAALTVLEAEADARSALPRAAQQAWFSTRSYLLHRADRLIECADLLAEVIRFAAHSDDGPELCTVLSNRSILLSSLGRFSEALGDAERAVEVLGQFGETGEIHEVGSAHGGNVHVALAYALTGLGRLDEASTAVNRAARAFSTLGQPWTAIAANAQASVQLLAGDADAAAAALGAPPAAPAYVAARHHLLRSRIAALRGEDPAPALDCGHAALATAQDATAALQLDGDAARRLPPRPRSARLAALARRAARRQQFAIAARLRWWRVQALLDADRPAAAARAVQALTRSGAAPSDWRPDDAAELAREVQRRARAASR